MTLDEIRLVLDMVREHDLAEFELEQEGVKLRVRKRGAEAATMTVNAVPHAAPVMVASAGPAALGAADAPTSGSPAPANAEEGVELALVTSPIVGTFYRSAEPNSPPFVNVGDTVRKNQVLCIIEAMKLMNEIVSEHDGEVVKAFVENGQPVQYGERLFAIRPT